MTWIKVCDGFDTDRRIDEVSLAAAGLFMRSVSYSARYSLDGHVDEKWLQRRVSRAKQREPLVAELIEAGLWQPAEGGGYEIVPVLNGDVDPLVNHFFKDEVEETRRKEAAKKRAQRDRRRSTMPEADGSVPEGQSGESPSGPRSGQGRDGTGRAGEGLSSGDANSDAWALLPEERLAPGEREAERRRREK